MYDNKINTSDIHLLQYTCTGGGGYEARTAAAESIDFASAEARQDSLDT